MPSFLSSRRRGQQGSNNERQLLSQQRDSSAEEWWDRYGDRDIERQSVARGTSSEVADLPAENASFSSKASKTRSNLLFLICGVRSKLAIVMLTIGVIAVLVTSILSYQIAALQIRQQAANSLQVIASGRQNLITSHVNSVKKDTQTYAQRAQILDATQEILKVWASSSQLVNTISSAESAELAKSLLDNYETFLAQFSDVERDILRSSAVQAQTLIPTSNLARVLQLKYIFKDLDPKFERLIKDYDTVLAKWSQSFDTFMSETSQFSFMKETSNSSRNRSDLLICNLEGDIIYSYQKRIDFGTNLRFGPHNQSIFYNSKTGNSTSAVSAAFQAMQDRALSLLSPVHFTDFMLYLPAKIAPQAFVSTPIYLSSTDAKAILIRSFPVDRIDLIVNGGMEWEQQGLRNAGEALLVGKDHRLRSTTRFFNHSSAAALDVYAQLMMTDGQDPSDIKRMVQHQTPILYQVIHFDDNTNGTVDMLDYRSQPVLAIVQKMNVENFEWRLICKQDKAELLDSVNKMEKHLLVLGLVTSILMVLLTVVFSFVLLIPVLRIQKGMDQFGNGNLHHRLRVNTKDEMENLAAAANRMARDLMLKTVSKSYVDKIVDSMSEALLVIAFRNQRNLDVVRSLPEILGDSRVSERASSLISLNGATIKKANSAAYDLFGCVNEELVGCLATELFPDVSTVEKAIERGVNGMETTILDRSGRLIPVLFSGGWLGMSSDAEFVVIARDIKKLKELEAQHQFAREAFGRYVTDDVVQELLDSPEGLRLGGERRTVTMLVSDLRGFTALSSRLTPEQVVRFLNRYLERMLDIILAHGGVIDEIIGDGIQVMFGAPISRRDDPERAIACGIAMQCAMPDVNTTNALENLPELEMGIAIHSGEVIAGNLGSTKRAKYGIVGYAVSITNKIENYTIGNQVLASDATLQMISSDIISISSTFAIDLPGNQTMKVHQIRAIGGKYQLQLETVMDDLLQVTEDVCIEFSFLAEKQVEKETFRAQVHKVSHHGMLVRSFAKRPKVLSDIKVIAFYRKQQAKTSPKISVVEIYGKVISPPGQDISGEQWVLRFTSLDPSGYDTVARLLNEQAWLPI